MRSASLSLSPSSAPAHLYLNNAATAFPKPPAVAEAVSRSLRTVPSEPGRSQGRGDSLGLCRTSLATLFDVPDPRQICLLPSATMALNTVINGILDEGGHAISTVVEHNSVLRPLTHMAVNRGATLTFVRPEGDGIISPGSLRRALGPDTRLIALTAASNVTGAIQPVEALAEIAADVGVPLLVDAAQSAGAVPLDYQRLPGRVYVAFAGHKGLLGPTGVGGLIVPDDALKQTIVGGTGVRSENPRHPGNLPLRHEAGTPNLSGFAGLEAGVSYILERGVGALGTHRHRLVHTLRRTLEEIPGVSLTPLPNDDGRAGIVSFTVRDLPPQEVGFTLFEAFGIAVRSGLHCAPRIHEHLGTAPLGTVRVSVGPFNTVSDMARVASSIAKICGR
jgi:cysteine desulfurase / selenocysteine lyase